MIKLINLLSEIEVGIAIPKFKNNDELAQYLRKNPSSKKELIDAIWDLDWRGGDEDSWDYVLQGWHNNDIIQYGEYNIDDEISVTNGMEGDEAHISTHPISPEKLGITTKEYRVKFGPNELYWYFY
jgi:hypothetical protein